MDRRLSRRGRPQRRTGHGSAPYRARSRARERPRPNFDSALEHRSRRAAPDEGALRALIYIRKPERRSRRARVPHAEDHPRHEKGRTERLTLAQFKEIAKEQLQLVLLDEERAIKALPKLIHARRAGVRDAALDALRARRGRAGTLDQARKRAGSARIEKLLGVKLTNARREQPNDDRRAGTERRPAARNTERLIAAAQQRRRGSRSPSPTPATRSRCSGAIEAHKLGLIEPILVGPSARIRNAAAQARPRHQRIRARRRRRIAMIRRPRRSDSSRPAGSRR